MTTPTRSQAVSTPKTHLSPLPNRAIASPRPGTANAGNRTISYKSPAVKTPASAHGHSHHVSVSSQPSSTPLAVANIHDELLSLNSPAAALINSIAPTGLTPLSTSHDGLGIGQLQVNQLRDGTGQRNPEAERIQRLIQVADTLKTKLIGHGVTRDGVERIARLHIFEPLWDEDNLTIAGDVVELDINFDPERKERVRDLILKINTPDGDSHTQLQASEILKKDLCVGLSPGSSLLGRNLDGFSENLQYLSRLDHVDGRTNCFDYVGGLYEALRKLWEEEKKRMSWSSETQHLCNGNVGEAAFNRYPNVGLSITYWKQAHDDTHDIKKTSQERSNRKGQTQPAIWTGRIYCEAGNPSVTDSQQWLSDSILTQQSQHENLLDVSDDVWRPDWRDPSNTTAQSNTKADDDDTMNIDKQDVPVPRLLNICFVFGLEPSVFLPVTATMSMNNEISMLNIDQTKLVTYQQALQTTRNEFLNPTQRSNTENRWSRSLSFMEHTGSSTTREHSYALYSATNGSELWLYPVSELKFNHPRQLAAVLPILRQHALLWTLLKTLVVEPVTSSSSTITPNGTNITNRGQSRDKKTVVKRSNAKSAGTQPSVISEANGQPADHHILPVDLTLDLVSDMSKAKLSIFTPILTRAASTAKPRLLSLSIAIGLNGKIEVSNFDEALIPGVSQVMSKIVRMLTLTEDLGMVIQWILEQIR